MEEFRILGEEQEQEQDEDMTYEEYLQRKKELRGALDKAVNGMQDAEARAMLHRMLDTMFEVLDEEERVVTELGESEFPDYGGDDEDVLRFLLATSLIESSLLAVCKGPMQEMCDLADKGCSPKTMAMFIPLMMLLADARTTLERAALTLQEMAAHLVEEAERKEREKGKDDDEGEESR